MTTKTKRILISASATLVLFGLFFFVYSKLPKFKYSLLQSKANEELEHPLIVTVDDGTIKLELSIVGRIGEFDKVQMKKRLMFSNEFPFYDIDKSIVLRFYDKDQKSKKSETLYSFIGYITNLQDKEYRIRVEDTYKNLIDEVVVSVGVLETADMGYCESAKDCVPVSCSCDCTGCGGFSYTDVVNSNFEDAWYEDNGCSPDNQCPQVCCPPRQIVCKENKCEVVELGVMNEN